jgi:hypothetical protein
MDSITVAARTPRYLCDENLLGQLGALGLRLRIEFDMEEWKAFIRGTEWPVVNASADPARHAFRPGEVFWLNLHSAGQTIATQVFRIIDTDDYLGLVESHALWFGDAPSEFGEARMLGGPDLPRLAGTVVQLSGLYIDPSWRRVRTSAGMRLVAAFVRLSHSFTLRNLGADWSVTLIEERVASPRMVHDLYAYPNAREVFEAHIPYLGRKERLTLAWMSRAELATLSDRRLPPVGRPSRLVAPMEV